METAVVGFVAAVIGAAAGLIASYVTARQQRQLEVQRLDAQLDAERDREVRLAVGDFATDVSRILQTLSWFTWLGRTSTHRREREVGRRP
jgi:hypothetical protein